MSDAEAPEASKYVVGETYARRSIPRFEFKPGATGYTGGGYPRVRSVERGPENGKPPGKSGDVFVSIHRLIAVVACYPAEKPLAEIQDEMVSQDVHHELGMPSANLPDYLSTRSHGDHSSITRAQQRAWAADAKRKQSRQQELGVGEERCPGCHEVTETWATTDRLDDEFCLDCTMQRADGGAIEVK